MLIDLAQLGEFGTGARKTRAQPKNTKRVKRRVLVNTGRGKFVSSSVNPQPRTVRPRCDGHTNPVFKCEEITDDQREQALSAYWGQGHKEGRWAFEAQSVQSVSRQILFFRFVVWSLHE